MLRPLDRETLRRAFLSAKPFPYVKIDNFLEADAARKIADAYPVFDVALEKGMSFKSVNERKKVQVTNSKEFSQPVAELNELLASPAFLDDLSFITSMPQLLADEQLVGGGIHMTGPGGRLDVHVDFNYVEERALHRRLNLLLYLNPDWQDSWGGQFQLWDKTVTRCEATFSPILNRCVIFETSEISYHGVVPINAATTVPRKSFAAYYYTKAAPAHWAGNAHSTIFVARPDERFKKYISMPAERARLGATHALKSLKSVVKSTLKN
jgi:Rps23 Pro-64 3,4-dihydroxylase Tpa1-like proline 4-hydroxylase